MAFFDKRDGECAHNLNNRLTCIPQDITEKIGQALNITPDEIKEASNQKESIINKLLDNVSDNLDDDDEILKCDECDCDSFGGDDNKNNNKKSNKYCDKCKKKCKNSGGNNFLKNNQYNKNEELIKNNQFTQNNQTTQIDESTQRSLNILKVAKEKLNCDTELCILKHNKIKEIIGNGVISNLFNERFKPFGPKNNNKEWLSDSNIDDSLRQIAKKKNNNHYYHIPFQMRDFEKNNTELATIDFKEKYDNGYKTFGVVLNTDYSTGRGIHWFAIFIDFRSNPITLEYFNSSGEDPLNEIDEWMIKTKYKLQNIFNKNVCYHKVSKIQHQYDNSSCGLYSIYYIYSRLEGNKWQDFSETRIPDKRMYNFRKYLFNEED